MRETKSVSLYQLSGEYMEALDYLTDPENDIDDQTLADTVEGLDGELSTKMTNVVKYARNLESTAKAMKEAEAAMRKRRQLVEGQIKRFREYVSENMLRTGITEIESPWFRLSFRKSTVVVVDDESLLDEDYVTTKTTTLPNKSAIKQAIQLHGQIDGAHLEMRQNLQIK